MQEFLAFFEDMPSWQKFLWVLSCLSFSWLFEAASPLFTFNYNKTKHFAKNLIFLACSMLINLTLGIITIGYFNSLNTYQFGILHLIDLPIWLELIISILVLDLIAQYTVHVLLHKVRWMWKLHLVHHSDTQVDASTGTRHHPGDYLLREVFSLIAVGILGAPLAFYLAYRIATIFFTYLSHANFQLPQRLDYIISLLFISPNMHKFHHHYKRPWTDSNYGNIFSIWDRIFGTFVYADAQKIKYGLDVLEDETSTDVVYQFKLPFNKSIKTD